MCRSDYFSLLVTTAFLLFKTFLLEITSIHCFVLFPGFPEALPRLPLSPGVRSQKVRESSRKSEKVREGSRRLEKVEKVRESSSKFEKVEEG